MLAKSGLSRELWAEAASTQVYTQNLLPTSRHPGTVPKELLTGRRQRVDHLRPWGCLAWAKVPKELVKSKLDPRSVKAQLVGYANSGYQLYEPGTRSIVTSWDVIFEEGKGHRALTILSDEDDEPQPPLPAFHADTAPGLILPRQPIAPRIQPNSGPLHPRTDLTPENTPGQALTYPTPNADVPPIPLTVRRSSRISRPTPALVAAQETLQRERKAWAEGEEWANDATMPGALSAESLYAYLASLTEYDQGDEMLVPRTYAEAMKRPDLWCPAMEEELRMMNDRGVFELVDECQVPRDKNIVECRWVFANKFNAEGEVVRRKAQLVAKGYSQVAGEDFDKTYAAVVRLKSLRMSAAIAAQTGMEIWQVDFVSAYLNSIPEHEVYMKLPPGFPGGEGKLARLQKTIYGLMQGGFDWY